MKYLKNIPYVKDLHHDIFGVGEMVGAGLGVAGNITATALTNQANKEIAQATNETSLQIHREDNAFNAEEAEKSREFNAEQAQITRDFNASEAEKSRQFNAEEAQKSREWNSEVNVQNRLSEAGLNTAMIGGGLSSTSSTASSSPASSSAPSSVPASASSAPHLVSSVMQTPDIASSVNAGINLAKASSEILGNKSQAKKAIAETAHSEELTKQVSLLNQMTPAMNKLLLQKQKLENIEKTVLIEYNQNLLDNAFIQGFSTYADIMLGQGKLNLDVNMFLVAMEEGRHEMEQQALLFEQEWKQKHFENSYRYGTSETRRKGWNVGAEGGANNSKSNSTSNSQTNTISEIHKGKHPTTINTNSTKFGGILGSVLGVSGQLKGGYEDSQQFLKHIRNEEFFQKGVEYTTCLNIVRNANYSQEIQDKARSRMREIVLSAEGYALFVRQLGKYKRMPSNFINQYQDFEDQQE